MITALLALALVAAPSDVSIREEKGAKHKPALSSAKLKPSAQLKREPRPDSPNEAAYFYWRQRISEDGKWPDRALLRAKEQRDLMLSLDGGGISAGSWTWLGPGNVGGRLRAIIIHPTQTNTMWAASCGGGIWKTVNGGTSWFPLDDFLPAIGVNSMAIDNANPDVLYAGTGEGFFNTGIPGTSNNAFKQGAGIFKTFDGGATWQQLASTDNPDFYYVNKIVVSPTDSSVVLAATNNGLFRSADAGATWTLVSVNKTFDAEFHPTDGMKAVCGKGDGTAQYSTNGGISWTNAVGTTGRRVELEYARSNPLIVYAAVCENNRIRIWQSADGGVTYLLKTTGTGISNYVDYNCVLWVDPFVPTRMLLGGVNMYRSTDSGTTFSATFGSLHADHHVITTHPGYNNTTNRIIFFGHDGGISRATDSTGGSSTDLNNNLGVTQFYGAAMNNSTGRLVAGAQDNGSSVFTGNPQSWNYNVLGGDGGFCAADQTDSTIFYATFQYAGIRRSNNSGSSFGTNVAPPENGGTNFNFVPYYMLDPNNQNRMLACGRKIWRSNNIRSSPPAWTMIKDVIQPGPEEKGYPNAHFEANPPLNSSTITVAQGNSDIIWVGYNNGQLWKTTNGTATTPTWTRVDSGSPLPDRWISRICIDPQNHNKVYVSFMGWEADNVWVTTNAGTSWTQITGAGAHALPAAPVDCLAIHQSRPGWLYAGTDIGIFTSSDDGQTWSTFTDGPGTVPIAELFWRNDNTLIAVTHGRGVYSALIYTAEEPVVARSYSLVRGIRLSGLLQDTYLSDDAYFVARPGIVFSTSEAPLQLVLNSVAPISNPAQLRFHLESKANQGNIGQTIALFNYNTNAYEDLDFRNAQTSDDLVIVTVLSNSERFIEPGTRNMRAKVSYKAVGPVFSYPWTASIDMAKWVLTP